LPSPSFPLIHQTELGIAVISGNYGYLQRPQTRAEVHVLGQILARLEIEVLGFGTDTRKRSPGRAWALVVRSDDVHPISWSGLGRPPTRTCSTAALSLR